MKLTDAQKRADKLLGELAAVEAQAKTIYDEYQEKIEALSIDQSEVLEPLNERIREIKNELAEHLRSEKCNIFTDGLDKIRMTNGSVMFAIVKKLRIPKRAMEIIEEHGWLDAIRTTKQIVREVVEKWPVEKLAVIGATRKEAEEFKWGNPAAETVEQFFAASDMIECERYSARISTAACLRYQEDDPIACKGCDRFIDKGKNAHPYRRYKFPRQPGPKKTGIGTCEKCGRENVWRRARGLCSACDPKPKMLRECIECGRTMQIQGKGMCAACYSNWRRDSDQPNRNKHKRRRVMKEVENVG